MEWDSKDAKDDDTVDRRGAGGGAGRSGGGGFGGGVGGSGMSFPMPRGRGGKGGLVGILLALAVAFLLPKLLGGSGFDLSSMSGLDGLPQAPGSGELIPSGDATDVTIPVELDPDRELADFAKVLITDTNDFWEQQFASSNTRYERTKLVLFTGAVSTGCGNADSGVGPFYCPADSRVYIDLSFFRELSSRFAAAGDFAQAYVVAHEVGHHIQNELGISEQVRRLERENPQDALGPEGLSTRQELQADCLAGVWAHSIREENRLEEGDLEEALGAAKAVGDDTIQRNATGRVNPESFSHGSAKSRMRWFREGYDSGDPQRCDTFSVEDPNA